MEKWGNIRVLTSIIKKIKDETDNNKDFSNISDFTEYHLRKALDKLESSQK